MRGAVIALLSPRNRPSKSRPPIGRVGRESRPPPFWIWNCTNFYDGVAGSLHRDRSIIGHSHGHPNSIQSAITIGPPTQAKSTAARARARHRRCKPPSEPPGWKSWAIRPTSSCTSCRMAHRERLQNGGSLPAENRARASCEGAGVFTPETSHAPGEEDPVMYVIEYS